MRTLTTAPMITYETPPPKPRDIRCRGIRGATTVTENTAEAMLAATQELLGQLVRDNQLVSDEIASAIFTVTDDLDAAYPAEAARQRGWDDVPLLCMREIPVPGSLPRCIRILLHVNTERTQRQIRHVYLHDAVTLRPTLAKRERPRGKR